MSDAAMLRIMLPTSLASLAHGLHLDESFQEWCVLLDPVAVLATEAELWSMNNCKCDFAGHVAISASAARHLREAAKNERVKSALAAWSNGQEPMLDDGQLKQRAVCTLIGLAVLGTFHTGASYYGSKAVAQLRENRKRASAAEAS